MCCSKSVIDVQVEEWRELFDKVRLREFLRFIVDVFFSAESEVVEDEDLAWLSLGYSLSRMRADYIVDEFYFLVAVFCQCLCVGFEACEIIFSRSALVRAENYSGVFESAE